MPLAPIYIYIDCIVNNVTQSMNIIYAGFPGLGFQVKNLRVMFVFAIVSFLFFSEY